MEGRLDANGTMGDLTLPILPKCWRDATVGQVEAYDSSILISGKNARETM